MRAMNLISTSTMAGYVGHRTPGIAIYAINIQRVQKCRSGGLYAIVVAKIPATCRQIGIRHSAIVGHRHVMPTSINHRLRRPAEGIQRPTYAYYITNIDTPGRTSRTIVIVIIAIGHFRLRHAWLWSAGRGPKAICHAIYHVRPADHLTMPLIYHPTDGRQGLEI